MDKKQLEKSNENQSQDFQIMKLIEEAIEEAKKDTTDKAKFKLGQSEKSKILSLIKSMLDEEIPLKSAAGLSKQYTESLCGLAIQLYNSGKYEESGNIFYVLEVIDPNDQRFSMGLGASRQMEKKFTEAAGAYHLCCLQDPFNPMPCFYLYSCYRQMDRFREAYYALHGAINRIGRNPAYADLMTKAKLTLEGFQKEFQEKYYVVLKEKNMLKEDLEKQLKIALPEEASLTSIESDLTKLSGKSNEKLL